MVYAKSSWPVLFLFLPTLIVLALYQSCTEVKDALHGVICIAKVVKCDQMAGSRGQAGPWNLAVVIHRDAGGTLRIPMEVPSRFGPFRVGDDVQVVYRPDAPESARLAAERSMTWPLILGGLVVAFLVWCVVVVWRGLQGRL